MCDFGIFWGEYVPILAILYILHKKGKFSMKSVLISLYLWYIMSCFRWRASQVGLARRCLVPCWQSVFCSCLPETSPCKIPHTHFKRYL